MKSNCIKFMDNTKAGRLSVFWRAGLLFRGASAGRLWFDRKLLTFNKGKHEILALHPLPRQQNRSEANWMTCSFAEKSPRVLVDKLAVSQQSAPATNEGNLV